MKIKRLLKVRDLILAEPRRYNQEEWVETTREGAGPETPPCGTMACIGGWGWILGKRINLKKLIAGNHPTNYEVDIFAQEYFGITSEQSARLFAAYPVSEGHFFNGSYSGWPDKYWDMYINAKTPAGRARAAAKRIDHFIKTKGAE